MAHQKPHASLRPRLPNPAPSPAEQFLQRQAGASMTAPVLVPSCRGLQQVPQQHQHHSCTQRHSVAPSPLAESFNATSFSARAPDQPLAKLASVRVPVPGSISASPPPSLSPEPRPCHMTAGTLARPPLQPGLLRSARSSLAAPSHWQDPLNMTSSSIGSVASVASVTLRRARSHEPPPVHQSLSYVPQRSPSAHSNGVPRVLSSQSWAPPVMDSWRNSPSVGARSVSQMAASRSDSLLNSWQTVSLGSSREVDGSHKTISSIPDVYWAGSSETPSQHHLGGVELARPPGPTLLQSRPLLQDCIPREAQLAKLNASDGAPWQQQLAPFAAQTCVQVYG